MPNRIVFLAPERLHEIITRETQAGRRAALAEALVRLLELQAAYTGRPHDADPEHRNRHERVATIMPINSEFPAELSWGIQQDQRPNGHGGTTGQHVLNGALIQHRDLTWSLHT